MSPCFVYVIESESGHFKIGMTSNPARRLRQLQRTQGPYEYNMITNWRFSSRQFAADVERELHATFEHARKRGEWFSLSALDLIELGEIINEHHQVDYLNNIKPAYEAFINDHPDYQPF